MLDVCGFNNDYRLNNLYEVIFFLFFKVIKWYICKGDLFF